MTAFEVSVSKLRSAAKLDFLSTRVMRVLPNVDLRENIKRELRLQLPSRHLYVRRASELRGDSLWWTSPSELKELQGSGARLETLYDAVEGETAQLIHTLHERDQLIVAVLPFQIGGCPQQQQQRREPFFDSIRFDSIRFD